MPCKTGTRKSIEAAKVRITEQREREISDPFRILWRELVRRVHQNELGFDGLSEPEKLYFSVGLLDGELYNGGFDQYFFNHSGSYYEYATRGLGEMGAVQALELLQRAKQVLFDFSDVPEDTTKRRHLFRERASPSRSQRLEVLNSLYCKDPDSISVRSAAFARAHNLV